MIQGREKNMNHNFSGDSRSNQRAKRRKTNLILNSLIVIVLLLIIIVSVTIFFGGSEKASSQNEGKKIESSENNQEKTDSNIGEDDSENTTNDEEAGEETSSDSNDGTDSDSNSDETSSEEEETSTEEETGTETNTEDVVSEGGDDPNVKTTITNPGWIPIGTSQTGEHVTVYDSKSADWQEMIQAMTYATGLDPTNLTVWFLGRNNESGSQSIGTISSKDQSKIYRVQIEWVDSQGWKPIKVEELLENDRR
jgi:cytoskeletal protein RodZ